MTQRTDIAPTGSVVGTATSSVLATMAKLLGVAAGVSVVYMTVATVLGVALRYGFHTPSRFLFESTELVLSIGMFAAIGYSALLDRHVRIDLIPSRFLRLNWALELFARLFTVAVASVFLWFSSRLLFRDIAMDFRIGFDGGMPRWMPMAALVSAFFMLAALELRNSFRLWRLRRTPGPLRVEETFEGGDL